MNITNYPEPGKEFLIWPKVNEWECIDNKFIPIRKYSKHEPINNLYDFKILILQLFGNNFGGWAYHKE